MAVQQFQKIREPFDGGVAIPLERKQTPVARDDDLNLGERSAFKDSIVRLILEDVKIGLGLQDCGRVADGP